MSKRQADTSTRLQYLSKQINRVVSIHDPWKRGMGLGDVDDIAAIYYLAKYARFPIIYIVNDVGVQDPVLAGAQTRFDAFVATYGARLAAINPNIQFISRGNWPDALNFFQQTDKIIVCARVCGPPAPPPANATPAQIAAYQANLQLPRDPELFDFLNTPANLVGKTIYGQGIGGGSYNFGGWPLPVSATPAFNLQGTQLVIPGIIAYNSDHVNRRVTIPQLSQLITVGNTAQPDVPVITDMLNYGVMKNLCLPRAPPTVGFLVRHANSGPPDPLNANGFNPGLGNNAFGLALYRGLNVQPFLDGQDTIANILYRYIASRPLPGGGAPVNGPRGDAHPWVNALLNTPGIRAFMAGTTYNAGRGQDVEDMFCEALAVAVELFINLVQPPPGQTAQDLLVNGFPNLSTALTFDVAVVPQVTSPLWDLFTVACIANDVPPAQIGNDVELVGVQNSFPTQRLAAMAGLTQGGEQIRVGGKNTKKRKRKKNRRTRR